MYKGKVKVMSTPTDNDLLREYGRARSESAFAQLVQRHLNLVYSVALRRSGHPELARDACQLVFIDLARKAGRLANHPVLPAWLHRAAFFAASRLQRDEQRRAQREAFIMSAESSTSDATDWDHIAPLLDEAVHRLSEPDRRAILLRFFENRTHQEVARLLGVSQEAARKRTERALACGPHCIDGVFGPARPASWECWVPMPCRPRPPGLVPPWPRKPSHRPHPSVCLLNCFKS